ANSADPAWSTSTPRIRLLAGLARLRRGELDVADDALPFFNKNQLIWLDVFQGVDLAAGPADLEQIDLFGFADAEVDAQVVLGDVAPAAAHLVDLLVHLGFVGRMGNATQACADAAAIGFHHHIHVAVVVEIAKGAATRSDRRHDPRSGLWGNVVETAIAQVLVDELLLRVARFRLELFDFGIHVAIANQDVRPAIVVGIEKSAAPAQEL